MNNYIQEEQEIDLRKLAGYLLRNIVKIILITILITLIAGSFLVYKKYKSRVSEVEAKRKELVELELAEEKAEAEKEEEKSRIEEDRQRLLEDYEYNHNIAESALNTAQKAYDDQLTYMDESYTYSLDPEVIYTSRVVVKATYKNGESDALKNLGTTPLTSELKGLEFILTLRTNKEKVADIIGLNSKNRLDYVSECYSTSVDGSTALLSVSVTTDNEKEQNEILDMVHEIIDSYEPNNESIKVSVLENEDISGYSSGVYKFKLNQDKAVENMKNDIKAKEVALHAMEIAESKRLRDIKLEDERKEEEERVLKEEKAKEEKPDLTVNIIKIGIKSLVLALFIGLFVSCGIYAFVYVMCGKIHSTEEISRGFGIRHLGDVKLTTNLDDSDFKCKRFVQFIKFIEGDDDSEPVEIAKEVIKINIMNHLADAKNVAIVSSIENENVTLISDFIKGVLSENGAVGTSYSFASDKISALKGVKVCDKAILVTEPEISKVSNVSYEIHQIRDLEKEIIGVVGII